MLKIAVCNDDRFFCSTIEKIITSYEKVSNVLLFVYFFDSTDELLNAIRKGVNFQLVFIDVSKELSKNITDINNKIGSNTKFESDIILIAFELEMANDYLSQQSLNIIKKPISADTIIKCIYNTIKVSNDISSFFEYTSNYSSKKIELEDVIYFESNLKKVKVVSSELIDNFYGCLEKLADKVPYFFIRPHGSYIVNYNKIVEITNSDIIMVNGDKVPISQRNLKYIRHIRGVIRENAKMLQR